MGERKVDLLGEIDTVTRAACDSSGHAGDGERRCHSTVTSWWSGSDGTFAAPTNGLSFG